MKVRPLKMLDACAVSGYTRDQIRALLRDLPPFISSQEAGKSKVFTRAELLTIAVIAFMERRYGIRRSAVANVVNQLVACFQKPRSLEPCACLNIVTEDGLVSYMAANQSVEEGLVIPLEPIFDRLDNYLGATSSNEQIELALGPTIVGNKIRR